jgi:hypothetical protein
LETENETVLREIKITEFTSTVVRSAELRYTETTFRSRHYAKRLEKVVWQSLQTNLNWLKRKTPSRLHLECSGLQKGVKPEQKHFHANVDRKQGSAARVKNTTAEQRSEIARKASLARWNK